jgi:hypothetical protein
MRKQYSNIYNIIIGIFFQQICKDLALDKVGVKTILEKADLIISKPSVWMYSLSVTNLEQG